jgi:hypothetical protein
MCSRCPFSLARALPTRQSHSRPVPTLTIEVMNACGKAPLSAIPNVRVLLRVRANSSLLPSTARMIQPPMVGAFRIASSARRRRSVFSTGKHARNCRHNALSRPL